MIKKIKKRLSGLDKYSRYSLYVIAFFALIVISLTSIYHVSGDGCWHMQAGKFISDNGKFPLFESIGRDEPFWSPPLYHLLAAAIFNTRIFFGDDFAFFAVKFISPVFGILALMFSFLSIKKMFDSKTAFYSVLFLAFIPIFIDYSTISYVESMLTFFVILSVYLMLKDKVFWSSVALGFAVLTKYNGLFVIPFLIYLVFKKHDARKAVKHSVLFLAVVAAISGFWFLRNWILLGNPIWPFLNFAFKGYGQMSYAKANLANIIGPRTFAFLYLGMFGVPDGNYNLFNFVNSGILKYAIWVWLFGTFIFTLPFILGFFKNFRKKQYLGLIVWIVPHIFLFILYTLNVNSSVSRIIIPMFPAISVFWAVGFLNLKKKFKVLKPIIALIIAGFIVTLVFKFSFAAKSWNVYNDDFKWVRENTSKDAFFVANGQCVSYNLRRSSEYINNNSIKKADYIWQNQDFKLDRRSVYTKEELSMIPKNSFIAYKNPKTGTVVYSVN